VYTIKEQYTQVKMEITKIAFLRQRITLCFIRNKSIRNFQMKTAHTRITLIKLE